MVESLKHLPKRPQTQGPVLPIPEPVVIRNDSPCKAMKLLEAHLLLGLDNGELRCYDRQSLELLSTQQVAHIKNSSCL